MDTTPPVVTINTPSNGSTTNDSTPQLNATFGGETVAYAWYNVNNTGNSTPSETTNNLTVTLLPLPDGTQNVIVYANDSAGNLNSSIVNFTVDTTPPVVTINTPLNSSTTNDPTPELNATFGGETVAYAWYNVNNSVNSTSVANTNSLTVTLPPLPEGAHNVTVYVNDSSGNLNSSIAYFTVDTTSPIAPAITVPINGATLISVYTWVNGTTSTDTVNVTVYVNCSITNASVAVSGNIFNISNVPLGAEGIHEINVSSRDATGNVNTTNATVRVTVDTIAPSITIISPANTTYSNNSIILDVITNQTANVTYSLNGDTNQSLYYQTISGNTIITGIEGTNNIMVYANDSAGNLKSSIINFPIDTTPPASITNLTASAYAQTYINWTWTDPVDSDFSNVSVYINGIFKTNVTKGTQYYYASGLTAITGYTIGTRTVDTYGNTNTTWVNKTQTTASYPPPASVLTTIIASPLSATVTSGNSQVFTATAKDQYGNNISVIFVWSSSNTTVGTVGNTGVFNGQKVGTSMIKAASGSVSGNSTATVIAGTLSNIFVLPDSNAMNISQTQQFHVTGIDENGNAVYVNPVWGSSNTSVGMINETTGIFTALTAGTASITATDGNISANATVIVMASAHIPTAGAPVRTGFTPSSPVRDITGSSRTFNLAANQTVNITWYINGSQVNTNTNITETNYTNANATSGTWNVTAIAGNANGTFSQEWIWIVTTPMAGAPVITGFAPHPLSEILPAHPVLSTSPPIRPLT